MKQVILLLCVLSVALAFIVVPEEQEVLGQFEGFMAQYNKVYTDVEYPKRYTNFKASLERIAELNRKSDGVVYGINQFADMSPEEFKETVLMKKTIESFDNTPYMDNKFAPAPEAPTDYDWRSKGAVTAVKNQGQCGSCWAFSATEAIESAWILAGHGTAQSINLAPQQIVDCDKTSHGCNGGSTESAFNYVHQAGGEEASSNYPYTAKNGNCQFNAQYVVAKIASYKKATTKGDETTLQNNLVNWGPLAICVDAENWQHYSSGVMTAATCCKTCQLDHCVQLVGYNTTSSTHYWNVRNSWGTSWGMSGYIHLEMGKNACGLTNDAAWPTV